MVVYGHDCTEIVNIHWLKLMGAPSDPLAEAAKHGHASVLVRRGPETKANQKSFNKPAKPASASSCTQQTKNASTTQFKPVSPSSCMDDFPETAERN